MLRSPIPDQQAAVAFIKSQADSQGLFGGNLESTYYAIETLNLLGEVFLLFICLGRGTVT
jgi:hypothetical protein